MQQNRIHDDKGAVWAEGSTALRAALDTRRTGDALTRFLISEMGYALVRDRGACQQVEFDPTTVSPVALTSLFMASDAEAFRPTVIVDPTNAKVQQFYPSKTTLRRHLNALIELRCRRPDFQRDDISLATSSIGSLWASAIEVCRSEIAVADKLDLLASMLRGHAIVAERQENGDYAMAQATAQVTGFDPKLWASEHRNFRHATDRRFGAWTADRFRAINGDDAPLAETVQAVASFANRPRQRHFYNRLIVPTVDSAGRDTLYIAVVDHCSVALGDQPLEPVQQSGV